MKKVIIKSCVLVLISVIVIITACFLFKPIAKVGSDTVRVYELLQFTLENPSCELERLSNNMAFEKVITDAGVEVSDEEVKEELERVSLDKDVSFEMCKKAILHQKVIEKFASKCEVSVSEAREYYEKNKEQYGETEPEFEKVKTDMQMQMGAKIYDEKLEKIMEENKVEIFE